jgi:CBS domain-containing protein
MKSRFDARTALALGVTVAGVLGTTALAITIILVADVDTNSRAQTVLNAILPLFGTWVGTVLAYYFSRENYESASDNTIKAVRQLSMEERLRQVPVAEAMTQATSIYSIRDLGKLLQKVVQELDDKGYKRLPVLSEAGVVTALFYREDISRYLLSLPDAERAAKTLQNLIDERADLIQDFACVSERATLAEAREAMSKIDDCKVVFVTQNGTKDGVMVGMLTNTDIAKHAML